VTEVDLDGYVNRIGRPDDVVRAAAREALDRVTLPVGGFGRLGDLAVWLAAARGSVSGPPLQRPRVLVFAAEHGVAASDVSEWPADATRWLVDRIVDGEAVVSTQATLAGVPVRVVDLGVGTPTGRIDREDALTVEGVHQAIAVGIATADEEIDAGADLLVLGDVGVGSTAAAAAIIGLLADSDAATVTGRGSGIDDVTWMRKCAAVRDAMRRGRPVLADHAALLATSGSADLAALTGLLLQSAARRTPVVLDGVVSASAAMVAQRAAFRSVSWLIASHRTAEPAQWLALDRLSLEPVLDLGLSVGEGVGALSLLPMLQVASALLSEVRPFRGVDDSADDAFADAT
jgi:nicotinate-nucleotide--dimethylbenzimidazole phosphoribosyltransferase